MPFAVLIGGLISQPTGFRQRADRYQSQRHEYQKLLLILSQFGLIFAIATVALGEWVAPTLSQKPKTSKPPPSTAKSVPAIPAFG